MRVGLIARGEDRGLGLQTWEWARHMNPDAVLLVDMGPLARGFQSHPERYDQWHTTVAPFTNGELPEQLVRDWLADLDVLYTAETWYDERLPEWAHQAHTTVVCHVNPEFFRWRAQWLPAVRWWLPTLWRHHDLPGSARLVPVPVPIERWPEPAGQTNRAEYLHVAGHRAAGDRNGTSLLLAALARCRGSFGMRVVTQDDRLPRARHGSNVDVEMVTGGVRDYWSTYEASNVLVMPRRYGGLCLPAHEAAGAGLGLVMTECSPNTHWPAELVPVANRQPFGTPGGTIWSHSVDVGALAKTLDRLAADHETRWFLQQQARWWAADQSWANQEPVVRSELERACG